MSEATMPATIATALVKAQTAAKAVEKTSKNTFHKYAYASAEAVIEEARGALAGAGLALLTVGWDAAQGVAADDHDRIVVHYMLAHTSGETWALAPCSTPVVPDKGRPEDKAEATALTYNLGYMLRGLLLLPRVSEGDDADQRDDTAYEPRRARRDAAPCERAIERVERLVSEGNVAEARRVANEHRPSMTAQERERVRALLPPPPAEKTTEAA